MISITLLLAFANLYRYGKRRQDENIKVMKDAIKERNSKESTPESLCKILDHSKEKLLGYFGDERWNFIMKEIDCKIKT